MFGRKEREKRSLDDMFKPSDDVVESDHDEFVSDDSEKEKEEQTNEKNSCVPINPLDCFGMEEEKTEKWLSKCVKFWYWCMSFIWFLFGVLTFAPVIFISNKVDVLFNDRKKSLMCGMAIYVVFVTLIVLIFALRGGADASQVADIEITTQAITTEMAEIVETR